MVYLNELNNEQRRAALETDGPLLIIAGAGAGKTKTITHRICHLIKQGVEPERILAITFTNKAAKEMRERVLRLISKEFSLNLPVSDLSGMASVPFVSTFHALGVQLIREHAALLGIPRHFSIADKNDSLKLIKESMTRVGLDSKSFEPGALANLISREKGNAVTLSEYQAKNDGGHMSGLVGEVWQEYERLLINEKSLDFDDLLLKTVLLLKENAAVRQNLERRWRYIHVDEYQDTNRVQYLIARYLAAAHRNICAVGDIDQTIYSWRGADIKNILGFERDYPDAKIIFLEENYRSTEVILAAANRVIAKNKLRREKNLFTKKSGGDKIGLFTAHDENDEARFVALKAKELTEEKGVRPSEIAVLYRANFQGRALEEAMLREEMPYQVLGTRFFERREIKDVLSYIKAALNGELASDLKRIINMPPRGLGKVTVLKLFAGQEKTLTPAVKKKVDDFRKLLTDIKRFALSEKPSQTIKYVLRASGIEEMLTGGGADDRERLDNIKELVTFATKYDSMQNSEEAILKFLEDAALQSDQDELASDNEAVKLMTAHAAKGLEFEYVFITGLETDLFPHRVIDNSHGRKTDGADEEERRLFYVALTRAKKKLYLSYASVRTIFGLKQVNLPSEFIFDVPEELIEQEEPFVGGGRVIYLD
ncbi:UvrD-helicase domain-containing protein [Patescibacteria group bacterium]|nr:UvrD-helicase domain-containing protein [Patescibacteria group bacterium]